MRISAIRLRNYRQFRNVKVPFDFGQSSDIHLFIGINGTGKTNLLNAITWCLYGDEPHLTDESRALPLVNMRSLEEAEEGRDLDVVVQVEFHAERGTFTRFRREEQYRIHSGKPGLQKTAFRVAYPDSSGNTKWAEGDDAAAWVERVVPEGIREYFFFDGERLDRYFREEAGYRVGRAVRQLAQIDLLSTVQRKLMDLRKEMRREAGRKSPAVDSIRADLDDAEDDRDELAERLEECKKQISIADEAAAELSDKLKSLPDVDELEEERTELETKATSLGERIDDKEAEKGGLLCEFGVLLCTYPALKEAAALIEEKQTRGEIPPPVDTRLLKASLEESECSVCGTELVGEAAKRVQQLLHDVESTSGIANELTRIEGPIHMLLRDAGDFESRMKEVHRDVRALRGQLEDNRERRTEIDEELAACDQQQVKAWAEARNEYEKTARQQRERKGALSQELSEAEKRVAQLQADLQRALKAEEKVEGLRNQMDVCSDAEQAAEIAKEHILDEVRKRIEERTEELFKQLIWKKTTYESVDIDENYNVGLLHRAGYEALGTASAAERELLALSFTLALHGVSGFDAPLVIDTPVARVSGRNRANFSEVLAAVGGEGKQTILFFTPDEYTSSVSGRLQPVATSRRRFRLLENEVETQLEDLSGA